MLVGQHRGGHKHSHLLRVACRLERRPHGHLGLAKAYVTAHKAVHGALPLHVGLDVVGCLELVGGVLVEETGLELVLHECVCAVGKALLVAPLGV